MFPWWKSPHLPEFLWFSPIAPWISVGGHPLTLYGKGRNGTDFSVHFLHPKRFRSFSISVSPLRIVLSISIFDGTTLYSVFLSPPVTFSLQGLDERKTERQNTNTEGNRFWLSSDEPFPRFLYVKYPQSKCHCLVLFFLVFYLTRFGRSFLTWLYKF